MKLVNFMKNGAPALGVVTDAGIVDAAEIPGAPATMTAALALGREGSIEALRGADAVRAFATAEEITYAPAVDDPEKILCVGKNYADHVKEVPELFPLTHNAPEIFCKFRNALAPHNGTVRRNPNSVKHDYEAEIAVVIGRRAKDIAVEDALDYVFGYTLANDISARDLQKAASQWTPGKACDTFCPLGPYIVTADEVRWDDLHITGCKNGEVRQRGCSRDMIYSIPYIVSFLSGCCTLEPGDVILTGTPAGVIFGRSAEEQDWLVPGDELTVTVPELGTLRVTVAD